MPSAEPRLHRSYLYAPGSDPAVMRKALVAGADAVVLDLEDAVEPSVRGEARRHVAAVLDEVASGAVTTGSDVMVRVARDGDGYEVADLEAVVRPGLAGLRLPKAESPAAVEEVDRVLGRLEAERGLAPGAVDLDVTLESARGVMALGALLAASDRVGRAGLGAADLLADLGASGDDDLATLHVRSRMVLESRAAGAGPPIDSVHTDLADVEGLRRAAVRARALGFLGKSVIHPRQLDVVHAAFTPGSDELDRARRIVAALDAATAEGRAAVTLDGDFIDPAVAARARALLRMGATP